MAPFGASCPTSTRKSSSSCPTSTPRHARYRATAPPLDWSPVEHQQHGRACGYRFRSKARSVRPCRARALAARHELTQGFALSSEKRRTDWNTGNKRAPPCQTRRRSTRNRRLPRPSKQKTRRKTVNIDTLASEPPFRFLWERKET